MSLLNSVLGSIGTGNRTTLPKPPDRAHTATPPAPSTNPEPNQLLSNNPPKKTLQTAQSNSLKRKFEAEEVRSNGADRPPAKADTPLARPKAVRPPPTTNLAKGETPRRPVSAATTSKPPPKGSYMDLMNQAKALQAEKASAGQHVGVIKHATTKKDHLSKSERRRREEELRTSKGKGKAPRAGEGPSTKRPPHQNHAASAFKGTARTGSPITSSSKDKPARPKDVEESTYRGTAGLGKTSSPSRRLGAGQRRLRDTDEYDSEDSFVVDDEEEEASARAGQSMRQSASRYRFVEDEESDASSDMEAGYDDVEEEERRATLQAKKDDERERLMEERLKQAKEAKKRAFTQGR